MGTVCCWSLWICTYMHQMYPLITPQIERHAAWTVKNLIYHSKLALFLITDPLLGLFLLSALFLALLGLVENFEVLLFLLFLAILTFSEAFSTLSLVIIPLFHSIFLRVWLTCSINSPGSFWLITSKVASSNVSSFVLILDMKFFDNGSSLSLAYSSFIINCFRPLFFLSS